MQKIYKLALCRQRAITFRHEITNEIASAYKAQRAERERLAQTLKYQVCAYTALQTLLVI